MYHANDKSIAQRGKLMYDMVRAGYTLRQIQRAFSIASVSTVSYWMESRGYPTCATRPLLRVSKGANGIDLWENRDECIEYITQDEER